MGDALVKGPEDERPAVRVVVHAAEIVPKPQREHRELESAPAAAPVERLVRVACGGGNVAHAWGWREMVPPGGSRKPNLAGEGASGMPQARPMLWRLDGPPRRRKHRRSQESGRSLGVKPLPSKQVSRVRFSATAPPVVIRCRLLRFFAKMFQKILLEQMID